jgi:hypothetical protein
MLENDHVGIRKSQRHPWFAFNLKLLRAELPITTHWTFFGSRENIKLNNPNPNAVPDSIRSSTGPSGAISNGRTGVDTDTPTQREKRLLPINVLAGADRFRTGIEFAADAGRDGENWMGESDDDLNF